MAVNDLDDDELLTLAQRLTGIDDRDRLFRLGLEALVSHRAALELARFRGSQPHQEAAPRRRPAA